MMRGISKAKTKEKPKKPFFPEKSNPSFGRVATGALFPGWHGAVAGKKGRKLEAAAWELGGGIAVPLPLAGGAAGSYAAHKRGALKKQPVKKAYDPERNRQRRLDRYANATNIGAGALGAGAIYHGAGAVNLAGKGRAAEKGKWVTAAGKAKKSNAKAALGYYKSAGKAGARSAAFATGAAGAAIASDRIRRYKKGRGAKYSPLRLTY